MKTENEHPKGMCWYNSNKKLCGMLIPRNASSSLRRFVGSTNPSDFWPPVSTISELDNTYTTFTAIRNPVSRVISSFFELEKRIHINNNHPVLDQLYTQRVNIYERFTQFINDIEKDFFDVHVRPQHYYLTNDDDEYFNVDYCLLISKLEEHLQKMCSILKLQKKSFQLNRTNSYYKNMINYFVKQNKTLRYKILKIYDKDKTIYDKAVKLNTINFKEIIDD